MPVLSSALTHTKPTGYDRAGNCRPKLSPTEISKRYILAQQCRLAEYQHMKAGQKVGCVRSIELRWNAFLGFREYGEKKLKKAKKLGKKLGVELQDVHVAPNGPNAPPKSPGEPVKAEAKAEGQPEAKAVGQAVGQAGAADSAAPPPTAAAVQEPAGPSLASASQAGVKPGLNAARPFNLAQWAAETAEPLKEPLKLRLCDAPGFDGPDKDGPDKGATEKTGGKKYASTEMV